MQIRVIMLVDLDYFFAQCEEMRNPSIKRTPVVVGVYSGRTEDSGAVSTANYIARERGVKSGMPLFLAKRKLENTNAVFLPVDFALYEDISEKVMRFLENYADRFEQVGIDEAYLDVSEKTHRSYEEAKLVAEKIKDELRVQQKLTCSIGVGPNKLVAKIAADSKKPDGLTVVRPEQLQNFLSPLPVGRLIGVGTKTGKKMQSMGINTIFDLASFDMQKLIEAFGRTSATYFYKAALGIDNEPVEPKGEPESVSRIATLKQDSHDINFIIGKTDQLCNEIHAQIAERKVAFKTIVLIVITIDLGLHTRSKSFETPTSSREAMKSTLREMLEKFLNETELKIRRVGVKVSNLYREEKRQKQLTSFIEPREN